MSGRGRGKSNESNESSDVSNSDSESESDMDQSQNSQELDDLLHTDTEAGVSDDSCRDPNYSPSTTPTKGKKGVNLLKIHILILPQHQKIHLDHIVLKQEKKSL